MIVLNVPYSQKELAKELGAQWDSTIQKWVAPHNSRLMMIKRWFPIEITPPITPDAAWHALPPRTKDPREIFRLSKLTAVPRRMSGFCGMCDSNVQNEWCLGDAKHSQSLYELHHIAQLCDSPLRPSELRVLIHALEDGSFRP
jgi:Domain of unknown function (DUF5710)